MDPKKNELFVGMKLYRDTHSRFSIGGITEYTVCAIGKKYLSLAENKRYRIDIKTLKNIDKTYSQNCFQLYRTVQEINDIREINILTSKIKAIFSVYVQKTFTLDQLRRMVSILEEK